MEREEIIQLVNEAANKSTSNKIKVGSIITKAGIPISIGWNQSPEGYPLEDKGNQTIQEHCVHAEVMSIVTSGLKDYTDCVMWISIQPCFRCACLIKTLGFKEVNYLNNYSGSSVYNLKDNNLNLTIKKVQ